MDLLPEPIQTLFQNPTLNYLFAKTQDNLLIHLSTLKTTYVQPYLLTPVSTLLASTTATAMPDLLSILLLAIILLISLKILDYARRVVVFWVALAFRVFIWGTLLGLAWYVWRVGVENAGRDLGWVFGVVEGFVADFQGRAAAASAPGSDRVGGSRRNVFGGAGGGTGERGYSRGW